MGVGLCIGHCACAEEPVCSFGNCTDIPCSLFLSLENTSGGGVVEWADYIESIGPVELLPNQTPNMTILSACLELPSGMSLCIPDGIVSGNYTFSTRSDVLSMQLSVATVSPGDKVRFTFRFYDDDSCSSQVGIDYNVPQSTINGYTVDSCDPYLMENPTSFAGTFPPFTICTGISFAVTLSE